jgi:hypothetical protein
MIRDRWRVAPGCVSSRKENSVSVGTSTSAYRVSYAHHNQGANVVDLRLEVQLELTIVI